MKKSIIKLADKHIGGNLCRLLAFLPKWPNSISLRKDIPIKKILIIRPGGLGDFLYLLPALKILKNSFPSAKVEVLCEKRNYHASVLTNEIDEIILFDKDPITTLMKLRRSSYDVVIDSEQFHFSSCLLAWLTGAKIRIGFKSNPERIHFYTHLINYSIDSPETDLFLSLLTPLGIKKTALADSYNPYDYIRLTYDFYQILPDDIKEISVRNDGYWVLGIKGRARYRSWPVTYYVKAISELVKKVGLPVVLVGAKEDMELAEKISAYISEPICFSAVGRTTLVELTSILLNSNFFVGIDSGAAVLANLLDIKRILIFGSDDPNKWTIKTAKLKVLKSALPCSPCWVLGQRKRCQHILCMQKITPELVVEAVLEFTLQ